MGNITVGEVKEAIQKLKCGTGPGDDGVCPEMLKAETEETPVILRDILQNIWTEGNAPASWRKLPSLSYQRKVTWVTVETGEASPFYLLQAKYFAESFLNASHLLWTISFAKS
ncbi:RNA-directed DNA polymerase from mobile element jockey-like [Elysia marginata]|uniref:RNA-directed DNA polymerase from mobile element jockey-like n=1 Tax=Elysia marginata TaxID=1093978 RepID=A0AAV4IVW6_9GAST|nr:RNA-directed DNA polymerase from mobile element jockey-like [Elysia marginata]